MPSATNAPNIIVVNAGEARFLGADPIIMGLDDVVSVCKAAPQARVIAVHMEAVNHCVLTREGLRTGLSRFGTRVGGPDSARRRGTQAPG